MHEKPLHGTMPCITNLWHNGSTILSHHKYTWQRGYLRCRSLSYSRYLNYDYRVASPLIHSVINDPAKASKMLRWEQIWPWFCTRRIQMVFSWLRICCIFVIISGNCVPTAPFGNKSALFLVMVCRLLGNKPLPGPMMMPFTDAISCQ